LRRKWYFCAAELSNYHILRNIFVLIFASLSQNHLFMLNYLKQNTLALLGTMALAFGATQTADAQVIWGAGSTNTRIDSIGTFAATDSAFAPLGWTTTTGMANVNYGLWKWYPVPRSRGTFGAPRGSMTSPSVVNGAAMFDSDYFYTLDNASAPHNGVLISPIIDLTGQTDAKVAVKFYTRVTEVNPVDSTHMGFSKDGGATWVYTDIRSFLTFTSDANGRTGEGWINVNISAQLAGATDLDSCMINFRFKGDSYAWAVDDISIMPGAPYDIEIVTQETANNIPGGFSIYTPGNNVVQPLSQVTMPNQVRADRPNEWGQFGARLRNKGASTMVGATHNAKLFLKIEKSAGGGVWNFKMLDSINIDTLKPDSLRVLVDTFDNGWRPDSVGVYRYAYYVHFDTAQISTLNDTVKGFFEITPNIYSKVPRATDGFPLYTSATTPVPATGNTISEFEWGSMYYFPRGAGMKLDSVRSRMFADTAVTGVNNANVSVKVYKYRDANGSSILDAQPTQAEMNLVAVATDTVPFLPLGLKKITSKPVDFNSISGTDPLVLNDTTIYFVSVAQSNANGLYPINNGTRYRGLIMCFHGGTNYNMSGAYCSNDIYFSNSAIKIGEIGAAPSTEWSYVAFGQDQIPSIALYVSPVVVAVNEVKEVASTNVNVYPNPAKTVLNVQVAMDAASDLRYIMTDASGRVVRMNTSKNIQTETVSFDVEQLSAGVYFISVLTNKGVSTHRFVKE
jgi:Secretion system C-terminal sorting domain